MSRLRFALGAALAAVLLSAVQAFPAAGGPGQKIIVIIVSQRTPPFEEAAGGFKDVLAGQSVSVSYRTHSLGQTAGGETGEALGTSLEDADLVFTLGYQAAQVVLKENLSVPVISGLVLRKKEIPEGDNFTGVALEFPVETQFRHLKQLLPDVKTVGVIYNVRENGETVEAGREAAANQGLELFSVKVDSPRELPRSLYAVASRAQVLWGIPDALVLNSRTASELLLFSFRNRVPFIGYSSSWVKAGALFALVRDYRDIGSQCGEMALACLSGNSPGSIPRAAPRKALLSINLKTARQMGVRIDEDVIEGAREVY